MLVTNPEALQLAVDTKGASLAEGLRLFTEDLARGRIAMTDETAFEVGGNICTTPGSVIYQNELIQLIQYAPTTDRVHKRPLVIVPPCINKYYILDLQPQNSFVAHVVAQGHTVFLAQRRSRAGQAELGRLHRAGCPEGHGCGPAYQQGRQGEHAWFLRRRHIAGERSSGASGSR
jgi:polyhydroxyalkanoate synthase